MELIFSTFELEVEVGECGLRFGDTLSVNADSLLQVGGTKARSPELDGGERAERRKRSKKAEVKRGA